MKNSRGISMISLIITIIVTVMLASMALSTGTRYLKDSKKKEQENFIEVLSSAVSKRHQDTNINSLAHPYLGYYIKNSLIFESVFAPKVDEDLTYEDSVWYIVDNAAATNLGVKEIGDYIESVNASVEDEVKVALVDYKSGAVYLINVHSYELTGLDITEGDFVTGHEHRYLDTEATCTTGIKCADCGFILKESLGHLYETEVAATPYDDISHYTKQCIREGCGMTGGFALHDFEITFSIQGGKWYHTIKCPTCNYEKANEECTVQYYMPETTEQKEKHHMKYCAECAHSEAENHTEAYRRISETFHELYCSVKECNYTIRRDPHEDSNNDKVCDVCGSEIIDYSYPQMLKVELVNAGATSNSEKYYAKYGDTITMQILADKKIQNLKVTIGGKEVPASSMSTVDQKAWVITYYLDSKNKINNGALKFTIDCESTAGVPMPSTFISTTDGNNIIFDGSNPIIQYINKVLRVNE